MVSIPVILMVWRLGHEDLEFRSVSKIYYLKEKLGATGVLKGVNHRMLRFSRQLTRQQ